MFDNDVLRNALPTEIPNCVLCSSQVYLRPVRICLTSYETQAHEKVNSRSPCTVELIMGQYG